MNSEMEYKVRKMDDKSKTLVELSEEIAKGGELKRGTVFQILRAKRAGFESRSAYREHLAKIAGFESRSAYNEHLKQVKFEESLKSNTNSDLESFAVVDKELIGVQVFDSGRQELRAQLEKLLGFLRTREREIIVARFYEGKTLKETGEIYELSPERIRQLQNTAIRKLKRYAGKFPSLEDYYTLIS